MTAADDSVGPAVPWADAVVVAAGTSRRMGGLDKITSMVGDRPLVAWSVGAIAQASSVGRIVLVVPPGSDLLSDDLAWRPAKVAAVVAGGIRRQDSVAAGIHWLEAGSGSLDGSSRVVLVHDGARPLVSPALVDKVAAAALEHGAAIPVLPVAETIKRVAEDRVVETVDRSSLATAQTPQGIRLDVLERAWAIHPPEADRTFTDEASLLEACSIAVHAIRGEPGNVKVTHPADLDRVVARLAPPPAQRVGIGHDVHPFGPGEPLQLGGIEIAGAPRLHGHSDGDVALHAVADALLGAAGLGDLGQMFPADSRTPRGVASAALLREVMARITGAGFRPVGIDLTIVAGRPHLAPHLAAMRDQIAALLGLDAGTVNVKASTANLAGPEGAGRAISAEAIASVAPSDRTAATVP